MTISQAVRDRVAATRAAQGLPPTVEDPAALERAAAVLRLAPAPCVPRQRRSTHTVSAK
jgi:hypothetical protein